MSFSAFGYPYPPYYLDGPKRQRPAYATPSPSSSSRLASLIDSPLWKGEVLPKLSPVSLVRLSHVDRTIRGTVMRSACRGGASASFQDDLPHSPFHPSPPLSRAHRDEIWAPWVRKIKEGAYYREVSPPRSWVTLRASEENLSPTCLVASVSGHVPADGEQRAGASGRDPLEGLHGRHDPQMLPLQGLG